MPTAELGENSCAAGGQLWDFWPVGKGAKWHLLGGRHAAQTSYFQWEGGFRGSRRPYNRRSFVGVAPSLGSFAHKCPLQKSGFTGNAGVELFPETSPTQLLQCVKER